MSLGCSIGPARLAESFEGEVVGLGQVVVGRRRVAEAAYVVPRYRDVADVSRLRVVSAECRGKQTRKRVLGRNKSKKTVDEPDTARTDDTVNLLTARTDDSVLTKQSGERAVSPVENAEDGIEHL